MKILYLPRLVDTTIQVGLGDRRSLFNQLFDIGVQEPDRWTTISGKRFYTDAVIHVVAITPPKFRLKVVGNIDLVLHLTPATYGLGVQNFRCSHIEGNPALLVTSLDDCVVQLLD